MPHKKAKYSKPKSKIKARTIRRQKPKVTQDRLDEAPSTTSTGMEGVSKSLARVLNASQTRKDYQERQNTMKNATKGTKVTSEDLRIKKGESLLDFNRRVETKLAPTIAATVRTSNKTGNKLDKKIIQEQEERRLKKKEQKLLARQEREREEQKEEEEEDVEEEAEKTGKEKDNLSDKRRKTYNESAVEQDFAKAKPRAINDIAMAPPTINKIPRTARKLGRISSESSNNNSDKLSLSLVQQEALRKERERAIEKYRDLKGRSQPLLPKTAPPIAEDI